MDPVPSEELLGFAGSLFEGVGLEAGRAEIVARGFLEADLLGFSTHGLARVPANLGWLERGLSRARGEPRVIVETAALGNWDARFLPGPYAMHLAVTRALRGAGEAGVYTMTLRRCQHVACLAAYLVPVVEAGFVGLLVASTPDEAFVSPFGGIRGVYSNNPLAFCAPGPAAPVLIDVSMGITAGGRVARAAREGRRLPEPCLKDGSGNVTDDPTVLDASPPGSIMPIGGLGHGHKGHALTVVTEVLTQALGGYGRATQSGDGEANSVYLQVLDPRAFDPEGGFAAEVAELERRFRACPPADPAQPVRLPGGVAWQRRQAQLASGVDLYPGILDALLGEARRLDVPVPSWAGG